MNTIAGMFCPIFTSVAILLGGLPVWAQTPQEPTDPGKVSVGVFDSRAVAIAYYRSSPFKDELKEKFSGLDAAKAESDEKRIKELEAEGPALQELMHLQSFGTWPIDNVLKEIQEEIPGIAKQASVQLVVSKWDIVYQSSGVEFVDITKLMVEPFGPDPETLKIISEIQNKPPIAADVLKKHKH